jgi:hypothetical protein
MTRKYYLLLTFLIIISAILTAILVMRAEQTDQFFKAKRQEEMQSFMIN